MIQNHARYHRGQVNLVSQSSSYLLDLKLISTVRWIWCSRIPSSGVQALAQDAENDVWFNIMSLAFPVSWECGLI